MYRVGEDRAGRGAEGIRWVRGALPSAEESYCAWFGDVTGDVLYFGEAPFWDAFRRGGDPTADLAHAGPQAIGRFSLADESLLPALPVSDVPEATGTWDVLAHPSGRVYFTTFFGSAGYVEPESGRVVRFLEAGTGLNELALLPDGRLLASRYAGVQGAPGSVVILDPEGAVELEVRLAGTEGRVAAAKSVAYDPERREIWVTTDLLARDGRPPAHDARILDARSGRPRRRIETPEVQFVAFSGDGAGALVERSGTELWMVHRAAGEGTDLAAAGRRVLLDPAFPGESDFAQELRRAPDGSWLVTRWSGRVHRLTPAGTSSVIDLPRPDPDGLYYTATLRGNRVCATFCGGITVVCTDAP